MLRSLLVTGAVLGLAAVGTPESAGAACSPAGRTVATTTQARVWVVSQGGLEKYYGCAFAVGRTIALIGGTDRYIDTPEWTLRVRGPFVAYQTGPLNIAPYRIAVRDLRTGRVVASAFANRGRSDLGTSGPVCAVRLGDRGAVAWTASADCRCEGTDPAADGWEVHVLRPGRRARLVGHGTAVQPASLKLVEGGRAVTWREGAAVRRASLT
jgi:hypothetical protein